jgi:hypothetical protein
LGRPEPLGISQQQWGDVEPESANSTEFRMESYGTGQSDISHTGAMLMKHYLAVCLSLVMCIAAGCSSPASKEPNDYVGEYLLTPSSVVPGEFASFVILKKDHTAVEITFSKDTGQITSQQMNWYLQQGTGQEDVVIGKRGYPIQQSKSKTMLTINGDLGQYYEKVR